MNKFLLIIMAACAPAYSFGAARAAGASAQEGARAASALRAVSSTMRAEDDSAANKSDTAKKYEHAPVSPEKRSEARKLLGVSADEYALAPEKPTEQSGKDYPLSKDNASRTGKESLKTSSSDNASDFISFESITDRFRRLLFGSEMEADLAPHQLPSTEFSGELSTEPVLSSIPEITITQKALTIPTPSSQALSPFQISRQAVLSFESTKNHQAILYQSPSTSLRLPTTIDLSVATPQQKLPTPEPQQLPLVQRSPRFIEPAPSEFVEQPQLQVDASTELQLNVAALRDQRVMQQAQQELNRLLRILDTTGELRQALQRATVNTITFNPQSGHLVLHGSDVLLGPMHIRIEMLSLIYTRPQLVEPLQRTFNNLFLLERYALETPAVFTAPEQSNVLALPRPTLNQQPTTAPIKIYQPQQPLALEQRPLLAVLEPQPVRLPEPINRPLDIIVREPITVRAPRQPVTQQILRPLLVPGSHQIPPHISDHQVPPTPHIQPAIVPPQNPPAAVVPPAPNGSRPNRQLPPRVPPVGRTRPEEPVPPAENPQPQEEPAPVDNANSQQLATPTPPADEQSTPSVYKQPHTPYSHGDIFPTAPAKKAASQGHASDPKEPVTAAQTSPTANAEVKSARAFTKGQDATEQNLNKNPETKLVVVTGKAFEGDSSTKDTPGYGHRGASAISGFGNFAPSFLPPSAVSAVTKATTKIVHP